MTENGGNVNKKTGERRCSGPLFAQSTEEFYGKIMRAEDGIGRELLDELGELASAV